MTTRRSFLGYAIALPVSGLFATQASARTAEIFNTAGIAIHGYDPVAYFKVGNVVDGTDAHALRWMGVTWRFSNAANMAAFEADPHRFEPQFGGYCAYAMSKGAIANTVPEAWTIHQGKLYLNFSTGVREIWRQDMGGYIEAAKKYWPAILNA